MTFGEKLSELRKSKALPRKAVAPELSVSLAAYGNWESDIGTPSLKSCGKICKFFDIKPEELFKGVEL